MKKIILLIGSILILNVALAEKPTFSGLWETNYGDLEIFQEGNSVNGKYSGFIAGEIKGVVKEGRLDFQWIGEDGNMGLGYFIISDDGRNLTGEWGVNESNNNGGIWNGIRKE